MHCNGNSVYIFLFWELRCLSPNFHIHVSMSDLYIPRIGPHISSSRKCRPIMGILYIIGSQTHECGNWDWDPDIPFLGILASKFRCFVFAVQYMYIWNIPFFTCRKVHTSRSDMLTFITIARSLQVLQMWFGFQILFLHHIILQNYRQSCIFCTIHRTQLHSHTD